MNPVISIQNMLDTISRSQGNKTDEIILNVINNEFITFNGKINIPKIPVKELDYDLSVKIVDNLIEYIPEFLFQHTLLKKRKPASEQHSLHFIKQLSGKHIYFIHIFKIDLKFSGDSSNIIDHGNNEFFPSFITDRIYYKSKLIPEISILKHEDSIIDFFPIRIFEKNMVESDQHFHTFAIFDEIDTKEISKEFCNFLKPEFYGVSPNLYPFVSYDYFTAAFNIIYPTSDEINKAMALFEPLFIYLYSNYHEWENLINKDNLIEKFGSDLKLNNHKIELNDDFLSRIKIYLQHFSLTRDDEMTIKGWRKFEIEK